jgi:hypothetical protein
MIDRDLTNATGLAAWIVANGYRPHMTRKLLLRLVWTDPAAPNPVPSAGSETVYSLSQWRCYLDPPPTPARAASISARRLTRTWSMEARWRDEWSSPGP